MYTFVWLELMSQFLFQFYCSLFPLLEADKILELRLLSRWMRMYAERYLHNNLRCRRSLRIKLGEDTADDGDDSNVERATPANYSTLESFLQEDRASRIRMPVKDFSLSFRNSDVFERDPNLPEFLEKYGRQIEYLGVPYITIPPRKCEVDFYEKLPRLRWLDIMSFREEDFGPESVASFPITFRSLETLRLPNCNPDEDYADENYKLKLLECCKELKYFYLLCFTQDVVEFKKLCGILKKKTNLHFVLNYCIENPCPWNPELTPELCSLARDGGVKLCEFPTRVLVTFNDHQLEQISRQIFSLKQYWLCLPLLENFCRIRVVFPNLHEIDIFIPPEDHFVNQDDQDIQDGTLDIENILWKRICPEMFPSVKRFIIDLAECPRLSRAPSLLWQFFPNLEELRFKKNVADIVFVGERGQFPFLRLTSTCQKIKTCFSFRN